MKTTYKPSAGTTIRRACSDAVALAAARGDSVAFKFNEIELVAEPHSDALTLAAEYSTQFDARAEAYQNSPEGKEAVRADTERARAAQAAVDRCMMFIPTEMDALMEWLMEFAKGADHIGVRYDRTRAMSALEAMGHKRNAHVGDGPESFNNRQKMGEYIIGQALDCLYRGMPPHPVTISFVEQYFALEGK